MESKLKKYLLIILILGIAFTGHFYAWASELNTEEPVANTVEENASEDISEAEKSDAGTEFTTEADTGEIREEDTFEETEKETTEKEIEEDADSEDVKKRLEELIAKRLYERGLPYFLSKYQYDCKISYMEKYIAYLDAQVNIYQEMYQLGEVTEAALQSCKAQKALAEAELRTAQNESAYYNLYITENELDYSDFDVKTLKGMEGIDYYRENYPEKDYMTMFRYVTDYNNAVINIEAKQKQVDSLKTSLAMSKLLLEEGELSEMEYMESEVSLANAEYELEQYYVSMNMAYVNIVLYCR